MKNMSPFEIVLGMCRVARDKANMAARYLGMAEYNPAKPETLESARAHLEDLRILCFDLHWKALLKEEHEREDAICHAAALEYAHDCRVRIADPKLPWHAIIEIVEAALRRRAPQVVQAAA